MADLDTSTSRRQLPFDDCLVCLLRYNVRLSRLLFAPYFRGLRRVEFPCGVLIVAHMRTSSTAAPCQRVPDSPRLTARSSSGA
jgi:hypothetical protein